MEKRSESISESFCIRLIREVTGVFFPSTVTVSSTVTGQSLIAKMVIVQVEGGNVSHTPSRFENLTYRLIPIIILF